MNRSYFKGVQALRGLAALSVMLFHFRWNINESYPNLGDRLFGWGATGVDLFFLISGFVIALTVKTTPATFSGAVNFLKRRAFRILPAYYAILIITFMLSGAMSTFHYEDKALNFFTSLIFQPAYHDHAPFYIDDSGMYGIRWTLNYEVYFYLVIGLLLMLPMRWLFITLWFIASLLLLPWFNGYAINFSPTGYGFSSGQLNLISNPMILLFIVGMIIGASISYIQRINSKLMALLAFASLIFAYSQFSEGKFLAHGLLSSGWIYALVLFFVIGAERSIENWVPQWLLKLGDISFSLYLIHNLFNYGLAKRFDSTSIEPGMLRFTLSIVLSLLLAWLSWRYIEKPAYRIGKRREKISAT